MTYKLLYLETYLKYPRTLHIKALVAENDTEAKKKALDFLGTNSRYILVSLRHISGYTTDVVEQFTEIPLYRKEDCHAV